MVQSSPRLVRIERYRVIVRWGRRRFFCLVALFPAAAAAKVMHCIQCSPRDVLRRVPMANSLNAMDVLLHRIPHSRLCGQLMMVNLPPNFMVFTGQGYALPNISCRMMRKYVEKFRRT